MVIDVFVAPQNDQSSPDSEQAQHFARLEGDITQLTARVAHIEKVLGKMAEQNDSFAAMWSKAVFAMQDDGK